MFRQNFFQSTEADDRSKGEGWQTPKKKVWMAGEVRMEELLAKVAVETNVWTRSKCRRCQTNITPVLQGKHVQAVSTKSGSSWSESSSPGEGEDKVLDHA